MSTPPRLTLVPNDPPKAITRDMIKDALAGHPGISLYEPTETARNSTIPLFRPRFDHAENVRIAARVGFDPARNESARDWLRETEIDAPPGTTRAQRRQAEFFAALGTFIFARMDDEGIQPPPDLDAWRDLHARCLYENRFFEREAGQ